jgi:hypothetical protein
LSQSVPVKIGHQSIYILIWTDIDRPYLQRNGFTNGKRIKK